MSKALGSDLAPNIRRRQGIALSRKAAEHIRIPTTGADLYGDPTKVPFRLL